MVEISVILPTYNRGNLIHCAIQSILKQSFTDFELIIVDDGSTDDTPAVIAQYDDPRICYLRQEQCAGASIARNIGVAQAKGRYIAFLDSDDEWLPTKLAAQHACFMQSKWERLGAVNCGIINVSDQRKTALYWSPSTRGDVFVTQLGLFPYYDTASMWLFDRAYLPEQPFDPLFQYAQMSDLLTKLAQHAQFDFVPQPLVIFHDHNQLPRNELYPLEIHLQAYMRYIQKYQADLQRHPRAYANVLNKRAHRYLLANRPKSARHDLLHAIKLAPKNLQSWRMLLFTLLGTHAYIYARKLRNQLVSHHLTQHFGSALDVKSKKDKAIGCEIMGGGEL